ncbi:MAG: gamma-glutamyl phosphate reductase [Deltaproteobacteria bacterium DG_8]|nr:MAG: gamma-glutamyl phosphate reductase [Deltaproteobacteria bacterium DG_8]
MDIAEQVLNMAMAAKKASQALSSLSTALKNRVLDQMAGELLNKTDFLKRENEKDLKDAHEKGLSTALIDRLRLSDKVIKEMVEEIREIVQLPDPVGEIVKMWRRPNNLLVGKMRIPLGVIGIIYESRPNVTVDAAALCLKSGNAVILRGGKEAFHSNRALAGIMQEVVKGNGVSEAAIQLIPAVEREAVYEMLKLEGYIDVIIPRGGEELIRAVVERSQIPVIKHYRGVCHIFVDASANEAMAESVVVNAKVQRPGVCNALETLLVHEEIAPRFLPRIVSSLRKEGVEVRACEKSRRIVHGLKEAREEDWYQEYLDLIVSIKIVSTVEEAIDHIAEYGSMHTDAIITSDYSNSQLFLQKVNSSVVLVNASTRFNDGNQLGLGSEIGISTTKLHAFGPMGLNELTTCKFVVYGNGQIREG